MDKVKKLSNSQKNNHNPITALAAQQKLLCNMRKYWPLYVMVIPGVLQLLLFRYIPLLGSVIAFQDFNVVKGIFQSPWVGLKHFEALFQYSEFKRVFVNTLTLGLMRTILIFPVPIMLALAINEVKNIHLKKTIQTALFIPYFLSWVIIGGLTFDILSMDGIFNSIRSILGLNPILIMQDERYFRFIYVVTAIWRDSGWGTIVYLAAIAGISPSMYESAMIDGASRLKQIRYITVPLLLPTILTLFLLSIGGFMDLGFEHVHNLLTPMTYSVGDIFDTYVFRNGIQRAEYSVTTAVGLFQSIIGFILVFIFNKLASKTSDGGLW